MSYRIEIKFAGDAPEDEMARAKIIANGRVQDAIDVLSAALVEAGLEHRATATSIRAQARRSPQERAAASEANRGPARLLPDAAE